MNSYYSFESMKKITAKNHPKKQSSCDMSFNNIFRDSNIVVVKETNPTTTTTVRGSDVLNPLLWLKSIFTAQNISVKQRSLVSVIAAPASINNLVECFKTIPK